MTKVASSGDLAAQRRAVLGVILAVALLALIGIFVKLSAVEPIATGAWRIALAMPLIAFWARRERRDSGGVRPSRQAVVVAAVSGVFLAGDIALWNLSFAYTTVANANLLTNLSPFIVVPAAWLLFGERVRALFLVGLAVALAGVVLLLANRFSAAGAHAGALPGDLLALGAAVFYGAYLLAVSRLRLAGALGTAQLMYYSGYGTLLGLIPLALFTERVVWPQTPADWLPLLALALVCHLVGHGLLTFHLRRVSSALASVLVLLQPLLAAVYAWWVFAERLGPSEIAGIGVCLFGIYMANRSQQRPPNHRPGPAQ